MLPTPVFVANGELFFCRAARRQETNAVGRLPETGM